MRCETGWTDDGKVFVRFTQGRSVAVEVELTPDEARPLAENIGAAIHGAEHFADKREVGQ